MESSDPRIYVGRLEHGYPAVYAVGSTSVQRLQAPRDAFGWGAGSADAARELARALLTDAAGDEPPPEAARRFARQILTQMPVDGFALQRETVNAWLRRYVPV